jgi:hypothetical protein
MMLGVDKAFRTVAYGDKLGDKVGLSGVSCREATKLQGIFVGRGDVQARLAVIQPTDTSACEGGI